ncbi:hypothetical protein PRZ48_011702 [Zasmidium cellare]|uniref:Fungal N-terminal domain-containing protein n=1 Tax=Zasmidium cellare TaxID=395010 RepID=A0ABR0E739_ZASCE|nr:hypothetical protein PRZ48_011702 [Zasmidium cellare]
MSDPLSVAAAAAGFLGVAGQLAEGIIKLRRLYNTVSRAPERVSDLLDSMQSLQDALQSTGEFLNTTTAATVSIRQAAQRCLLQCQRLRRKLTRKLLELERKFRGNRLNSAVFVFREAEIDEMFEDLERCKTSLIISQQIFESHASESSHADLTGKQNAILDSQMQARSDLSAYTQLSKQHNDAALRHYQDVKQDTSSIRSELSNLTQSMNTVQNSVDHHHLTLQQGNEAIIQEIGHLRQQLATLERQAGFSTQQSESILRAVQCSQDQIAALSTSLQKSRSESVTTLSIGFQLCPLRLTIEQRVAVTEKDSTGSFLCQPKPTRQHDAMVDLRLPIWFVRDQYRIAVNRSLSGWKYNLRYYRQYYFANLDPLMEACQEGNVPATQQLLQSRSVSPFDKSSYGLTASDYALIYGGNDMYDFMKSQGLPFSAPEVLLITSVTTYCVDYQSFGFIRNRLKRICTYIDAQIEDLEDFRQDTNDQRWPAEKLQRNIELAMLPSFSYAERIQVILRNSPKILLWGEPQEVEEELHSLLKDVPCEARYMGQRSFGEGVLSLLHLSAIMIARRGNFHAFWKRTFAAAIAAGIDVHEEQPEEYLTGQFWGTPMAAHIRESLYQCLDEYVDTHTSREQHAIQKALQRWLHVLLDNGIDLEAYGSKETAFFNEALKNARAQDERKVSDIHLYRWLCGVQELVTGPEVTDWKITYSTAAFTTTLSDFWTMVGRPAPPEDVLIKMLAIKIKVESAASTTPGMWPERKPARDPDRIVDKLCEKDESEYAYCTESVRLSDPREAYERLDLGAFEVLAEADSVPERDERQERAWVDDIMRRAEELSEQL